MEFMIKDKIGGLPLINDVEFKPAEGHWPGGPVGEDAATAFKELPHRFDVEQVGAKAPAPAPSTTTTTARQTGIGRGKRAAEQVPQQQQSASPAGDATSTESTEKPEGDGEKKGEDEAF